MFIFGTRFVVRFFISRFFARQAVEVGGSFRLRVMNFDDCGCGGRHGITWHEGNAGRARGIEVRIRK